MLQRTLARIWQVLATFYVVVAFTVSMPEQFPLRPVVSKLCDPFLRYTGLWQGWAMFAPNPISEDIYVSANFELSNGTKVEWDVSRMNQMSFSRRYKMERWRKWANDNLRLDSNKLLWPAAGGWMAKEVAMEYKSSVTKIEIFRHWQPAAIPQVDGSIPSRPGWSQFMFYSSNLAH